jgi:hypothetical protein
MTPSVLPSAVQAPLVLEPTIPSGAMTATSGASGVTVIPITMMSVVMRYGPVCSCVMLRVLLEVDSPL